MNIEVIGCNGVVGNATYELLHRLGHNVFGSDKGDRDRIHYGCDIYVICTPEEAVGEVVDFLYHNKITNVVKPFTVVRSTTPIGTCEELERVYGVHICHWPEHLREATSLWDAYFPPFISFGECCEEHGDLLESLLKPVGVSIIRSDLTTSEATKYAINNIKSVIVSYWNEFHDLGKKMGFNSHLAARIATNDPVVPRYGTILGGAFGGKCLPKDLAAAVKTYEEQGLEPHLLKAALQVNEETKERHGESTIRTA